MATSFNQKSAPKTLVYPEELANSTNRPMIQFNSTFGTTAGFVSSYIYMPIPMNISCNDAASYNDAELGFFGASVATAAIGDVAAVAANAMDSIKNATDKGIGKTLQNVALLSTAKYGDDNIKAGVSIGVRAALNKNITTQFTGTGTRSFQFQFKFIASSSKESRTVANIVETFRRGLYPIGDQFRLEYPATWNIKYLYGVGDSRGQIDFLPKIFPGCYLTTMATNYNSIANSWRVDGSPLDTEMTLTFIEPRALTREDIEKLTGKNPIAQDFVAQYSKPSEDADTSNGTVATPAPVQPAPVNPAVGGYNATNNYLPLGF